MSYTIAAYQVSPYALQNVWGSGDATPLVRQLADDLERLDADFGLEPPATAQAALEDIADGIIRYGETIPFDYGYVYELLCGLLGTRVEPDDDDEFALQYLDMVEPRYSAFLPIPFSGDFPHVVSYAPHELEKARARFASATPNQHPATDALMAEQFMALFDRAETEQTGVVLFNY